jgi:hypothetical protein
MLHHISIAVHNPLHVAQVLAEIFKGRVVPFPFNPGSYATLAGDEFGTLIELYPLGSELIPDACHGEAGFQIGQSSSHYVSFHAAISVPVSLEEIERIGEREGWRVFFASRDGLFDVIEFWVENRLMLELLTPAMTTKYLQAFDPETLPTLVDQLTLVDARR